MLLECLVYLGLVMLLTGLGLALFYRTLEQSTHLQRNAADILRVVQAGERWRADVRAARGPAGLAEAPGRASRVLRLSHPGGEVAYGFWDGIVWRRGPATPDWQVFLAEVKTSQMVLDTRQHLVSCRWEVELSRVQKAARVRPQFTFQAVPAAGK